RQSAVDRRPAHPVPELLQIVHKLLRLKQTLLAQHRIEHHGALGSELELLFMKISAEDGADRLVRQRLSRPGRGLPWEAWQAVRTGGHSCHYRKAVGDRNGMRSSAVSGTLCKRLLSESIKPGSRARRRCGSCATAATDPWHPRRRSGPAPVPPARRRCLRGEDQGAEFGRLNTPRRGNECKIVTRPATENATA